MTNKEKTFMKHKPLHCGKMYSISGNLYKIVSELSYGYGLLSGVRRFIFEPENKLLPELSAVQWMDGEIVRISRYKK